MRLIRKIAFLAFAFIVIMSSSNQLSAQSKYGYLNYGNLMEQVPEFINGTKKFETFRDQLLAEGETRAQKFQNDYLALSTKAQKGEMTGMEIQKAEQNLKKEQQALATLEQEVLEKVGKKRDEILKPIVDKIDQAIKDVGKENGYAMIFDSSVFNFIMYHDESVDVMPLVKKKLGIN